jgi:hypothetical protein
MEQKEENKRLSASEKEKNSKKYTMANCWNDDWEHQYSGSEPFQAPNDT